MNKIPLLALKIGENGTYPMVPIPDRQKTPQETKHQKCFPHQAHFAAESPRHLP